MFFFMILFPLYAIWMFTKNDIKNHRITYRNGVPVSSYTFQGETYAITSRHVPQCSEVEESWIEQAYLQNNDLLFDVTSTIKQFCGPAQDFHGIPVDMETIFYNKPIQNSVLVIKDLNSKVYEIDMNTSAEIGHNTLYEDLGIVMKEPEFVLI